MTIQTNIGSQGRAGEELKPLPFFWYAIALPNSFEFGTAVLSAAQLLALVFQE